MNMIKDILEERKSSTGKGKKEDFLDDILGEVVGKKIHNTNPRLSRIRLSNIVPGIFRKVVNDVKIEGFTIPAGWIVLVCPPSVHLDSNNYEDPHVFNPWRWKALVMDLRESTSASKKFMAFGGGLRLCAGADLSKLQISFFLRYFVTKFRWIMKKEGNIVRKPGLCFRMDCTSKSLKETNKKVIKASAYEQLIVFNFML
ncbi:hypothetical protein P3S68_017826 [Capsicum galapagoense]